MRITNLLHLSQTASKEISIVEMLMSNVWHSLRLQILVEKSRQKLFIKTLQNFLLGLLKNYIFFKLLSESKQLAKKKAALTLLTMYRKYPELFPHEQWAPRLIPFLGEKSRDLGVITSVVSLAIGMVSVESATFADIVPRAVGLLTKVSFQFFFDKC